MPDLTRRRFHQFAAASTLALGAVAPAAEDAGPRLAVSTWSLHNYFPNTRYGSPQFKLEEWTLLQVLRAFKEQLGLTHVELSSAHLASFAPDYLRELAGQVKELGCRFIHLSDNFRGVAVNLARAERDQREADLKKYQELIGVAQALGIPSMRVNTGAPQTKDWDFALTIDCFRRLAAHGKERGVEIVVENHGGLSADPKNVARLIEAVGDNISACPDFGLFKSDAERWPGLELLFRHSRRVCSAKFHGIEPDGSFRDFDVKRCYDILRAAKFPGWVSLEYEGPLEPLPQLQKMARLAREWLKA